MRSTAVALIAGAVAVTTVTVASAAPGRGETRRVSASAAGEQATGDSRTPSISGDGRFVVFESDADGLVPGDDDHATDVFLRDLREGTVEQVSVRDDGGAYGLAFDGGISADGRYVVFQGGTGSVEAGDWFSGIFLWDRIEDRTEVVGLTDDERPVYATDPVISRDGRYIAFLSTLADHGDTGTRVGAGVYVRDRARGTTRLVSVTEPPATGDGYSWIVGAPTMSADGSRVAYTMNQARPGLQGATYTWDRRTGLKERFDRADGRTGRPTFSGNGRYAAFSSAAPDLVPGDTNGTEDVFVRDMVKGTVARISLGATGAQVDARSYEPVISEDGHRVAFVSGATDLVAGDTARGPLFSRDLRTGLTQRVTVARGGGESDYQGWPDTAVSRDGKVVAFDSWATNLVSGDTNDTRDVFVRRLR
ncbi:TolB family protein [Streptomyces sp. NPDC090106]|uniref:TolB family protein n=1 Tax=Streptomyces sp. NPDC090106 TaxID=3365946 RepID=UPI00381D655C